MSVNPKFLKTGDMAKYLGLKADTLRKNLFKFEENIHYYKNHNGRYVWNVKKMEEWRIGKMQISNTAKQVLDLF